MNQLRKKCAVLSLLLILSSCSADFSKNLSKPREWLRWFQNLKLWKMKWFEKKTGF